MLPRGSNFRGRVKITNSWNSEFLVKPTRRMHMLLVFYNATTMHPLYEGRVAYSHFFHIYSWKKDAVGRKVLWLISALAAADGEITVGIVS